MSDEKAMIMFLTVGLIKKISLHEMTYFPEPYTHSKNKIVELDLSNYAIKSDLKKSTSVGTSKFAKKVDLVSLKSDVDELDIDKLKTVLVDLCKLSNILDNDVVRKAVYDKLVSDASGFVLKTQYTLINQVLKRKLMTLAKNYLILVDWLKR